jgi:LytS/YehU family sensor histidine kinase
MYTRSTLSSFYILLSWSGLYFGSKYYQMLQVEKQNVLKANAVAHQAQLKMLRYQLNPHFLFNTLNAISTLILVEENKTANSMVTKLSEFLRYSLDKDPMKKVTLETEIQALQLYLAIEQVRFEDRLRLDFQIAEECQSALVPSMILQPLAENAIKHAIAVQEQGGTITITVRRFADDLLVEVSDDGPGAEIIHGNLHRESGVGLVNTRERLQALYREKFSLVVSHNQPSGVKVNIRMPFQLN